MNNKTILFNLRIPLDKSSNQTVTIKDLGNCIFLCENKKYYGVYELIELILSISINTHIKLITKDGYGKDKVVEKLTWFILCQDMVLFRRKMEIFDEVLVKNVNIKIDDIIKILNKFSNNSIYRDYMNYLKEMKKKGIFV